MIGLHDFSTYYLVCKFYTSETWTSVSVEKSLYFHKENIPTSKFFHEKIVKQIPDPLTTIPNNLVKS